MNHIVERHRFLGKKTSIENGERKPRNAAGHHLVSPYFIICYIHLQSIEPLDIYFYIFLLNGQFNFFASSQIECDSFWNQIPPGAARCRPMPPDAFANILPLRPVSMWWEHKIQHFDQQKNCRDVNAHVNCPVQRKHDKHPNTVQALWTPIPS